MEQKLKQRICIEFCVKIQISATETFEMLKKAFPNDPPKRTTVFEWHSIFKAGRISIEDDPRQGRPKFQRTDENVQKITDLIKENPRTTLLELEQDTGISKTTIGRIVTEDLKLKKTPAKFIPRFLTNEQKLCRLATCEDMMEMTRTDPEWKDKIITGDETWVYGYDPETKPQSAEWRGQTVIKEMYLGILPRLREAIRKKRPEKWTNGGWILHHDNARPHTAHLVTSFLAKNGTQILLQPPYFPDIAPNDFFLFPKLKAVLKGRHFDTRDDIIEKSPLALKSIPKEAYKNCFNNWEKRWRCQKLRTLLRLSATKNIREIEAELEKESPSRKTIGIKFEVLETIENQLRDANMQVMNLLLEDEAISLPDLEKEQDMVVQYEKSFVRTELRVAKYLQVRETGLSTEPEMETGLGTEPEMETGLGTEPEMETGLSTEPKMETGLGTEPEMETSPSTETETEESETAQIEKEYFAEESEKAVEKAEKRSVVEVDEGHRAEVKKNSVEIDEEKRLDVEQGMDSENTEEVKLDAEQGTDSKVEEKITNPKDWLSDGFIEGVDEIPPEGKGYCFPDRPVFGCESKTTPIRPVFNDASCRGHGGLALKRYLKRKPSLLGRIPEIRIKFRENKFGVLADMGRYLWMIAIKENDWDYLGFLWMKKTWTTYCGNSGRTPASRTGEKISEYSMSKEEYTTGRVKLTESKDGYGSGRVKEKVDKLCPASAMVKVTERKTCPDSSVQKRSEESTCPDCSKVKGSMCPHCAKMREIEMLTCTDSAKVKAELYGSEVEVDKEEPSPELWPEMPKDRKGWKRCPDIKPKEYDHLEENENDRRILSVDEFAEELLESYKEFPPVHVKVDKCGNLDEHWLRRKIREDLCQVPPKIPPYIRMSDSTKLKVEKLRKMACFLKSTNVLGDLQTNVVNLDIVEELLKSRPKCENRESELDIYENLDLEQRTLDIVQESNIENPNCEEKMADSRLVQSHVEICRIDEEPNGAIGAPRIEISEVSIIDKSEGKDSNEPMYSSSAYMEWPEILKKEVLKPEALEKAAKQLRIGFYMARDQMSEIAEILANDGTEWKFNPPGAPHFGGLWEAGIKCFKYHFRRIIGEALLTYEEFLILIVQIEACLNSRPLGPISSDPNDLAVLTPAHFLLTSSSYCVPEEDLLNVQLLPRWKMVQRMVQHLWRQWSTDYIHNLQQRHKWRTPRPNVATGSLVLVREEHVPPAKWIMGRVVEIHPGKNGLVRVVSIRTGAGLLKRPLVKLALLPVPHELL
ncbi:hypothetical protein LAZ67_23001235 [Cordylochernes scorpioides]|uniref:DUF5641 domain-containing protein n=1 Tax=Cordylochernes scorpioides TaxID=51811 RepID=A0ABY6LQX8_9ARAC|nr:hypothetical protein LAZ67_23001235 [Cordylochernes scorpioides]